MAEQKEKAKKRRWGDRKDGAWVRDMPSLNVIMSGLYPNRTDCEVYLKQDIDITELLRYIERKNSGGLSVKMTLFHCFVSMIARTIRERPVLNRFVQGRRVYQRNDISISFIAKKHFSDTGEESLMQYIAKETDTTEDVSRFIVGDVTKMREGDKPEDLNSVIDKVGRLPRPLLMLITKTVRILDFWGKVPKSLTRGDTNYASVLVTNLGSIKCPSVYHHLNNYGTTSIFIAIGTMHKASVTMPDGTTQLRDIVDVGATVDERIGDGFYFARSLKLVQHICSHPEILDLPLGESSGYDFS